MANGSKIDDALSKVVEAAGDVEVMVFCGVAKLLNGMGGQPHDMDLLVRENDLPVLDERLAKYQLSPPDLSDNEFFSRTLAKYRISGIDVDVSAGILAKGKECDFLLELDHALASYSRKSCQRPLVIPLEEQLLFDSIRRDKPEKAQALLEHFTIQSPDIGFLKERMDVHDIPGQVRARLLAALGV